MGVVFVVDAEFGRVSLASDNGREGDLSVSVPAAKGATFGRVLGWFWN